MRTWRWGPLPARLNHDPRVVSLTRAERGVFYSLYAGADEHGLFGAEEMPLRLTLGIMDFEPVQPTIIRCAEVGLVHLYRHRGTLYGVIDQYDADADPKTLADRPRPTMPMPPAGICEKAGCSGVYSKKVGGSKTKFEAEPDPESAAVDAREMGRGEHLPNLGGTPEVHPRYTRGTPEAHPPNLAGTHDVRRANLHGTPEVHEGMSGGTPGVHAMPGGGTPEVRPRSGRGPAEVATGQDRTGQDTYESTLSVSNMDLTTRARMDAPEVAPPALKSADALGPQTGPSEGWKRLVEKFQRDEEADEKARQERERRAHPPRRMMMPIPVPTGQPVHQKAPKGMSVARYETQCFDRFEQAMGMQQPGPQDLTPEQEAEEMAKLQQRLRERRVAEGRDPDTGALLEPETDPQPPEPAA